MITFKKIQEANKLLEDNHLLSSNKFRASIPNNFITSKAIIKDIDISLSEEEILNNKKILHVRRLKKKINNSEDENIQFRDIPVILVTFRDRVNIVGIKVHNIDIYSIYIPPDIIVDVNFWKNFTNNSKYIICGDFNCHHKNWGNSINNRGGIELNILVDEGYFVVNNDLQPTVIALYSKSVIDLIISSPNLLGDFSVCKTLDDSFGSDHFPIVAEILNNNCTPNHQDHEDQVEQNLYNYKKTDWTKYYELLDNIVITSYHDLIQAMKWSLSQSAPAIVRKNNKYLTKPPWWDDECLEAIKKRKEAFRKFKDISDERNFIEIKKEIARSRRI
ncbi:hypothetical protein JTB14_007370 [Gonioctena quinquepunctata]|nr:hypothetical protein JTB14_007370 [Gonioctena quinquepunctata]